MGGLVTGFQGIAATPDDQFVAYVSGVDMEDAYQDNQTSPDIYLRWAGGTQLISRAFGSAVGGREPSISADGRYIAFSSQSRALTPDLDDLNNGRDVFIYDRFNDTFARVSIPPSSEEHDFPGQFGREGTTEGAFNPHLTADGKRVIFSTDPLVSGHGGVDIYERDLEAGETYLIRRSSTSGFLDHYDVDSGGNRIVIVSTGSYATTAFGVSHIEVLDISDPANPTILHSVSLTQTTEAPETATISGDGKFLFYFLPPETGYRGEYHVVDLEQGSDNVMLFGELGVGSIVASEDGNRLILTDIDGVPSIFIRSDGTLLPVARDVRGVSSLSPTVAAFSDNGKVVYFVTNSRVLNDDPQVSYYGQRLYRNDGFDIGAIKGEIWRDANGNGVHDPRELPTIGATVFLDLNNNGVLDPTDRLTTTDPNGAYEFTELRPGNYTIRHLPPRKMALSLPAAPSRFNIDLSFADNIPQNIRDGIRQAADRWMKIIVGDLPNVGDIDDLSIYVQSDLSLPGSVLAKGAFHGVISWRDPTARVSANDVKLIALHEIGHVLGFGTLWRQKKLVDVQIGVPVYTGKAAVAMYRIASDTRAKIIPLENTYFGEPGSHWGAMVGAEGGGMPEVMLPNFHSSAALSTVTIGAMQDLGYQVNYAQADFGWAGTYAKYETMRSSFPIGADKKSYAVNLIGGAIEGGLDFGVKPAAVSFAAGPVPLVPKGSLQGVAFLDGNRNGRFEKYESTERGSLTLSLEGVPTVIFRPIDGHYRIDGIPLGTYRVSITIDGSYSIPLDSVKLIKVTKKKLNVQMNIITRLR